MATTTTRDVSAADAKAAHENAYGGEEPLDTPVPSDRRLVQIPDGTASASEANERREVKPAPEHVEGKAKTDTVHPLPGNVDKLKAHNDLRADAGEAVEPVGPGNATAMTDRAAPAGTLPDHEPGTFLHGQTKEQVEATKRYSEPNELPPTSIFVTTRDGQQEVKGAVKGRAETDGSLSLLAGPLDPAVTPKVVKTFRAGEWSYWGKTRQP